MGIKRLFTGSLLLIFFLAILAMGLGGRSESLPFWPGAFALASAALWGAFSFARGYHGRALLPALWAMFGFATWIIFRAVLSYYDPEGVAYLARQDILFAGAAFICYVMVTAHFEKIAHRKVILGAIFVGLVLHLHTVWIQVHGHPTYQPQAAWARWFPKLGEMFGWTGYDRILILNEVAGVYQCENHFAGYLAMVGPILLALALYCRGWLRIACWVFLAFSSWAITKSTSRGGTVAFLIGMTSVVVTWTLWKQALRGKRITWKWVVSSLGGLVVLGLLCNFLLSSLGKAYGKDLLNSDQIKNRINLSSLAWKQFQTAPVMGTGARSFDYMERSFRSLDTDEWSWYVPTDIDAGFAHDDWMQLAGDYGFLGLGFAFAVLVTHLVAALHLLSRTAKEPDQPGANFRAALAAGSLAGILGLAAVSILDFNLHIASNACMAAILLGFLANPGRVNYEEKFDHEGMPIVPRHGLLLRPLMLIAVVVLGGGIWIAGGDLMKSDVAYYHGEKYAAENNYFEASAHFQEAIDRDPHNYHAGLAGGDLNQEEARLILASLPKGASPAQVKMQGIYRRSHLNRAAEWYAMAHNIYPRNPYTALGAADALSRAYDLDAADGWFQKALVHGQSSRKLAIEHGTHLMRRASVAQDMRVKLRYLTQALEKLIKAEEKFRCGAIERDEINVKIRKGLEWKKDLEKLIVTETPSAEPAEKTPANAPAATPAAPAPLVPAATDAATTIQPLP